MRVFILGIDHEIQKVDAWRSEEMKTAYRNLLAALVHAHGIQYICEEASPDAQTIGAELTTALQLPSEWKRIDMPSEARTAAGIAEEQMDRVPIPVEGAIKTHSSSEGFYLDLKNGWHQFCPRVPSDTVREDFMFGRALEGARGATSIMVLCGNFHVEALATRFKAHGDDVQTDAVYKYDWYDPG
jgi:hypothetical protein